MLRQNGGVRIWHQQNESMDQSMLTSTLPAGGGGGGVVKISLHQLVMAATIVLSLPADHVHPFLTNVCPSQPDFLWKLSLN